MISITDNSVIVNKMIKKIYKILWCLNNKEHIQTYSKNYYSNNINKIKKLFYEKIYCEFCHKYINKWHKSQHYKSKKHIINYNNFIN